ncbi:MAG: LuxR C-terminal-related transcriptional regulator [Reichenbachiella sp.]
MRDGLADATITSILQDRNGFMWFGTYRGVNRFNGYEFTSFIFEEDNPNSLHDNVISCLLEDHEGKIWIGSYNTGVSIFDPKLELFTHYSGGKSDSLMLTDNSVTSLFEDSDHNIWIGTEYGLSMLGPERKTFKKFYASDSVNTNTINDESIYDIVEDAHKRIWLATGGSALCRYDRTTQEFTDVAYTSSLNNLTDNLQKKLYLQDSILWVTSNRGGLSRLNINTLSRKNYAPNRSNRGPSNWKILDIVAINNQLWLATDGAGLDIFDLETELFTNYQNSRIDKTSLSSNILWSICKDRQNNVWIGSYQGGVNKFDSQNNFFQLEENNPCDINSVSPLPILSLCKNPDGGLWIGTDWGGLQLMKEDGSFEQYNYKENTNSLSTNVVKSLCYDRNGNLLIGTYNHGLSTFNSKTAKFKHFKNDHEDESSIANNNIWCLLTDSKGLTWLGTLGGGIVAYDPDLQSFSSPNITYKHGGQLLIFSIFEDSQSNLWFSTDEGIIYYHRRTDTWDVYLLNERSGIQNHELNYVKSIIEDKYQHIWMATSAGLLKYMPENDSYKLIQQVKEELDLPILDMTEDDFGNLILIAKTNILQFDLVKEKAINYLIDDNSFNTGSFVKESNGKIILGGFKGLTTFNPKDLRKNDFVPPVYVTEFQIFNQEQKPFKARSVLDTAISFVSSIDINYEQSVINFKYAALNFSESERNEFAYKLEGFDEDWNYVGNRRIATYTNLNPGSYTFKVKASNNHNIWNEEGKSIQLHVQPPFWKTLWFQGLSIILISILLVLLFRMRIKQVKSSFAYKSLKIDKELIKIKNDSLNEQLDATRNELANITMSHLHKNQKLLKVRKRIEESVDQADANAKRKMKRIVKEIDLEIEDHDYWDKFEHQFNKSHNNFLERFKQAHPDLSKRELRICAYLRMGLGNPEISGLMNVTVRTIETSRYRIRKKIALEERQSFTKMIHRF